MWQRLFFLVLARLKFVQCIEPGADCLYGAENDCSPEMSKKMFDESAKIIFQILISTGKEWWPTQGTAIGILRYGQNFDLSSYSFSPIGTDTDIDVMIRVDDDVEWEELKRTLEEEFNTLFASHFTHCNTPRKSAEQDDYLKCWTNYNIGGEIIHSDITRYQVNEEDNYAFVTQSETLQYPFQKWKNRMVYKGGIADKNGKLSVALYDNMPVPCALNIVAMLSQWNGGEYAVSDVRWPRGGILKDGAHFKWNNDSIVEVNLTENDKIKLRKLWNDLHNQGYMSFIENEPQIRRWNVEKKTEDKKIENENVALYEIEGREVENAAVFPSFFSLVSLVILCLAAIRLTRFILRGLRN